MVKILCAQTVILSLSLLQMGLITSVFAAPIVDSSINQSESNPRGHELPQHNTGSLTIPPDEQETLNLDPKTRVIYDKICEEGYKNPGESFWNQLVSMDQDGYLRMGNIVKAVVEDEDVPVEVKKAALNRIAIYEKNPATSDQSVKVPIAWWLDFVLFNLEHVDAAKFKYRYPRTSHFNLDQDFKVIKKWTDKKRKEIEREIEDLRKQAKTLAKGKGPGGNIDQTLYER
ncbi:hypothetical protein C8R42DRAFT_712043 [Lentinula raphanica]|nr:hypothetical protein C8R42DRAFT_712043 [Lentinula raphanica]